jgi:hypothetical protein
MRKYFLCLGVLAGLFVSAQKAVILQHNGSTTVFSSPNSMAEAYNAAVDGDTIYLPGGVFPSLNISKRLAIYGVGHYPDSTAATGITNIAGFINFSNGSGKSFITGLKVDGVIGFEHNLKIDSVVIMRCYAAGLHANSGDAATNCKGILAYQNVFGSVYVSHTEGIRIFNNIIAELRYSGAGNPWIRNNKISTLRDYNNALFENNTIQEFSWGVDFNTFRNNIIAGVPGTDNNTWINNYYSVDFGNLFVKQTTWFGYGDDYHLKTPASYPGTDGNQAGLYGGYYPYKAGAVPPHPHIQSKTIPLQTNASGQLNIQVKVSAQNN